LPLMLTLVVVTDIICGFPTETEEDFEETMSLCRRFKFPSLFINQFFPRPGTPAANMKRYVGTVRHSPSILPALFRLATKTVKARSRQLSELFASYRPYERRLGQRYVVLVTDVAHDGRHLVGHNEFYEQVLVPKEDRLMGKLVPVEVVKVSKFSMEGKVIEDVKETANVKAKRSAKGSGMTWLQSFSVFVMIFAILTRILHFLAANFSVSKKSLSP